MCLQDLKIARLKSYRVTSGAFSAAGTVAITVRPDANRVHIRFFGDGNDQWLVFTDSATAGFIVGTLKSEYRMLEFDINEFGTMVQGQFLFYQQAGALSVAGVIETFLKPSIEEMERRGI